MLSFVEEIDLSPPLTSTGILKYISPSVEIFSSKTSMVDVPLFPKWSCLIYVPEKLISDIESVEPKFVFAGTISK